MKSSDLKKVIQGRVALFNAPDSYLAGMAIDEILAAVGMAKDDYDFEMIFADNESPVEWVANVGMSPFLSERRFVLIRNAQKAKLEELSVDSLKALPESALFMLFFEDAVKDRNFTKVKIEKVVTSAGGFVGNLAADPKEVREVVKASIKQANREIGSPVLDLLLEMTGSDLGKTLNELEKVYLFSDSKTILERDIKAVVLPTRDFNIWNMIDAVVRGDISSSLTVLRIVLQGNGKVEDFAFAQLFPLVSRQLRYLLQARVCIDANVKEGQIPEWLSDKFPEKPNLAKDQFGKQSMIFKSARLVTTEQVRDAITCVYEADARCKGMGASFTTLDTVERLIFDLARVLGPKRA